MRCSTDDTRNDNNKTATRRRFRYTSREKRSNRHVLSAPCLRVCVVYFLYHSSIFLFASTNYTATVERTSAPRLRAQIVRVQQNKKSKHQCLELIYGTSIHSRPCLLTIRARSTLRRRYTHATASSHLAKRRVVLHFSPPLWCSSRWLLDSPTSKDGHP